MQAVILAGGRGTRLGGDALTVPKPMLEIGGRPNLEHQIVLAARHGFTRTLLLVSHLADRIEDCLGDGSRFGTEISYCVEDPPLGTAGALRRAGEQLESRFLLLYGDVFVACDFGRLWAAHAEEQPLGTLVVHPTDHPYDCDLVEADAAGWITAIHPKSRSGARYLPNQVSAGVMVIERAMLGAIEPDRHLDLASEVLPAMGGRRELRAYRSAEYFRDFGTPDRLARTRSDYAAGRVARRSRSGRPAAVFLDRDGVINKEVGYLSSPEQMQLIPGAAAAIRRLNEAAFLVIVVTNQPVVARGECTLETLGIIHNKMETLLGREQAWADAIYFCPHHPDKGFAGEIPDLKIECACRKPGIGLFARAVRDWNIDVAGSSAVGDSGRDIIAARRMGLFAIGVRTGNGCRDCEALAAPDRMVEDLYQAVDVILATDGSPVGQEASA